jgi:hypothetical protein
VIILTQKKWWKPMKNNTSLGQYFNATMEYHDKQLEHAGLYDEELQEEIKRDTVMNLIKYGTDEDRELTTDTIDDEIEKRDGSEDDVDLEESSDPDENMESPEIKHEESRILAYSLFSVADSIDDIVNEIFDVTCDKCGKQFDSPLGEKLCEDCRSEDEI